ncbi:hypothetical protein NDN08_007608 [Rhodosorus marinus]|uniref:Uncharacterized protein n=1 Tax=Rhodosorus marinus TaxID=101924 RepID=A0AAV8V2X1_9RHOD|nr:hypothetical protein NDN08_007608 [Rhodosorus marinus]
MKTGIVFAMVLLGGTVQAYWAKEEPAMNCCDIKASCLGRYGKFNGNEYIKTGVVNGAIRQQCTSEGRGHWCVAEVSHASSPSGGGWYCVSPGYFMRSNFPRSCKEGKWPNSGSKRGCEKKTCKSEGGSNDGSSGVLDRKCAKELERRFCED